MQRAKEIYGCRPPRLTGPAAVQQFEYDDEVSLMQSEAFEHLIYENDTDLQVDWRTGTLLEAIGAAIQIGDSSVGPPDIPYLPAPLTEGSCNMEVTPAMPFSLLYQIYSRLLA